MPTVRLFGWFGRLAPGQRIFWSCRSHVTETLLQLYWCPRAIGFSQRLVYDLDQFGPMCSGYQPYKLQIQVQI